MPTNTDPNPALIQQLLDALDALSGLHPGFRPAHAKGLMCAGTFAPSPEAAKLTAHLTRAGRRPPSPSATRTPRACRRSPTTTRSDPAQGGSPYASILPTTSTPTSSPTPPTASPSARARSSWSSSAPRPPSGRASRRRSAPSSRRIPTRSGSSKRPSRSRPVSRGRRSSPSHRSSSPTPRGSAATGASASGRKRGPNTSRTKRPPRKSANFLFDEIGPRLAKGPIRLGVFVQLAGDGDDVTDASVAWPDGRPEVPFGTITLTERVDDQEPERRKIIFDPIPRVDGIDSSGDPLTEVRSEIYLLSGRRRRAAVAK